MGFAARGLLPVLADNDNAPETTPRDPRARAALGVPLRRAGEAPLPALRRFHEISGERLLSSVVAVEHGSGEPRWRISVQIAGHPHPHRRDVALLLAQQLALGQGQGPLDVQQRACTVFVRRALSSVERALLARAPHAR